MRRIALVLLTLIMVAAAAARLWFLTAGLIALMLALGASMLWTGRFV